MDATANRYLEPLNEEECSVCRMDVAPSSNLCENGHFICDKCKRIVENCPNCGSNFSGSRFYSDENISRLSMCDLPLPTMSNCPFSAVSGMQCAWTGKLEDIKKHLLQNHDKKISDKSGKFSMPFTAVKPQASYSLLLSTLGEVFVRKAHIKDGVFYLAVMYIGPPKNASKYKYSFTISKKNSVENISICQRTRSFLEHCDAVFRSRHCIKLHFDVVSDFLLDSSDLPNVMEITKA